MPSPDAGTASFSLYGPKDNLEEETLMYSPQPSPQAKPQGLDGANFYTVTITELHTLSVENFRAV